MKNYSGLRKLVLAIGLFLIGISLYCSFLLYTSFSHHLGDRVAWGGMGLGLDLFKNVALLVALALWTLGFFAARLLSVVVGLAYGVLTVLSFTAFFGFMATVQHQLEKETLLSSTRYESLRAEVDGAERKVAELSRHADADQARQAQARLAEAERRLADIRRDMSRYAHPDCTPKHDRNGLPYTTLANEWCQRLEAARAEARPWKQVIEGHRAYKAALAHQQQALKKLSELDSGQVEVSRQNLHPMFVDLGRLVAKAPEETKVAFMFVSSAAAELLGTLSVVIASFLGRRRSYTLDEIESMSEQLQGQRTRLYQALGLNPSPEPPPPGLAHEPVKRLALPENTPAHRANSSHKRPAFGLSAPVSAWKQAAPEEPAQTPAGEDEKGEIRLPDLDYVHREVSEAILRGECPPGESELMRRYHLTREAARRCLGQLARQGLLRRDERGYALNTGADSPRLGEGIAYRESRQLRHILFPQPRAQLPVRRKNGEPGWVVWGRRERENGRLPPGGLVPLAEIRAGEWDRYATRPVVIPASRYLVPDPGGRNRWVPLDPDTAIQGLVATRDAEQRVYVVTVAEENVPGEEQPRLITLEKRSLAA